MCTYVMDGGIFFTRAATFMLTVNLLKFGIFRSGIIYYILLNYYVFDKKLYVIFTYRAVIFRRNPVVKRLFLRECGCDDWL